jgi:hypothetical protein
MEMEKNQREKSIKVVEYGKEMIFVRRVHLGFAHCEG